MRQVLATLDCRILVVDDASVDGTAEIADQLAIQNPGCIRVLHRRAKRGLGPSYLDAFTFALGMGAERIIQMDADLSHDPQDLSMLLAASEYSDLVVGSRYLLPAFNGVQSSALRRWLSRAGNRYVQALTHLPVTDCTSGYRCWTRSALQRLDLTQIISSGFSIQVELLYAALRAGCRVIEVPIRFRRRYAGRSKLSFPIFTESLRVPWTLRRVSYARPGLSRFRSRHGETLATHHNS